MQRISKLIALVAGLLILVMIVVVMFQQRLSLQARVNKGIGSTAHYNSEDYDAASNP